MLRSHDVTRWSADVIPPPNLAAAILAGLETVLAAGPGSVAVSTMTNTSAASARESPRRKAKKPRVAPRTVSAVCTEAVTPAQSGRRSPSLEDTETLAAAAVAISAAAFKMTYPSTPMSGSTSMASVRESACGPPSVQHRIVHSLQFGEDPGPAGLAGGVEESSEEDEESSEGDEKDEEGGGNNPHRKRAAPAGSSDRKKRLRSYIAAAGVKKGKAPAHNCDVHNAISEMLGAEPRPGGATFKLWKVFSSFAGLARWKSDFKQRVAELVAQNPKPLQGWSADSVLQIIFDNLVLTSRHSPLHHHHHHGLYLRIKFYR